MSIARADTVLDLATFDRCSRAELRRATRYSRPTSLLRVEIDRYSRECQRFGPGFDEAVGREISALLRCQLREHDLLVRLNEKTFVILLPETPEKKAVFVAERIHAHARDCALEHAGRPVEIGFTIGVTCCVDREADLEGILQDAETALAAARRNGGIGRSSATMLAEGQPIR
jgi:two-component system, cell cycle response regulator